MFNLIKEKLVLGLRKILYYRDNLVIILYHRDNYVIFCSVFGNFFNILLDNSNIGRWELLEFHDNTMKSQMLY